MVTIAIDGAGGDNAPREVLEGAVASLGEGGFKLLIVGRENEIKAELGKRTGFDAARLDIVNADEVITNEESPTAAIRQKKNSSVVTGLNLLKDGLADGFISAGSTGALLTGATVIVGRIKGIERPALGAVLPNKNGFFFLIDCGANVDAKPGYLEQFAKMGAVYCESLLNVQNPRVGLVNIGAEREKGNALTKEAYPLLEQAGLNFIGNAEARDLPLGSADVAVCDAFTGNVILKYTEGFAGAMMSMIKKELSSSAISKIGALLARKSFSNLKRNFDYSEIGGAPFLGLNRLVVKAHGSSSGKAFAAAIRQCRKFSENDITGKIAEKL